METFDPPSKEVSFYGPKALSNSPSHPKFSRSFTQIVDSLEFIHGAFCRPGLSVNNFLTLKLSQSPNRHLKVCLLNTCAKDKVRDADREILKNIVVFALCFGVVLVRFKFNNSEFKILFHFRISSTTKGHCRVGSLRVGSNIRKQNSISEENQNSKSKINQNSKHFRADSTFQNNASVRYPEKARILNALPIHDETLRIFYVFVPVHISLWFVSDVMHRILFRGKSNSKSKINQNSKHFRADSTFQNNASVRYPEKAVSDSPRLLRFQPTLCLPGLRQTIPRDSSPGPSALLSVNRGMCLNDQGLRTEQLISPTRRILQERNYLGFLITLTRIQCLAGADPQYDMIDKKNKNSRSLIVDEIHKLKHVDAITDEEEDKSVKM
ncbi:hypothetical protein RND71_002351 [Anisodus tanguticus]|uniref:Uncharacterized protein n=1 Tax=Anisodus tanguticus TaxID=243964 RepID=A0AAE1T0Y8_9SOLA|nr:hypothetical protein RND71_002351 [Anisodus tanguticus]